MGAFLELRHSMAVSGCRPVSGKPPTRSTARGQSPHRLASSSGSLRDFVQAFIPTSCLCVFMSLQRGGGSLLHVTLQGPAA